MISQSCIFVLKEKTIHQIEIKLQTNDDIFCIQNKTFIYEGTNIPSYVCNPLVLYFFKIIYQTTIVL